VSSSTIGLGTVLSRSDEPVAVEVEGRVVMMSVDQGMYFGLEGVGPRIWSLLEEPRSVRDICETLAAEFDVDAATCEREVLSFLGELRSAELVRVHADSDAESAPNAG
jgi:hypothetical protein